MHPRFLFSILAILFVTLAAACSQDASTAFAPDEGLALAGKGGGKGGGGGGGGGLVAGSIGSLSAADQAVVVNRDNKVELNVGSDAYTVAADFANTVAVYGVDLHVTAPNEGVPAGEPNQNCWLNGMDDPSAYDPSVTNAGIAALMMHTLTYDGSTPRGLTLNIYKRELGNAHYNHALGLTDNVDSGNLLDADGKLVDVSTNPAYNFRWGQNTPPSGDFLKVTLLSGNANKANPPRVFELRDGMIRVIGRLGPAASDELVDLLCDVHPDDSAIVTVQSAP